MLGDPHQSSLGKLLPIDVADRVIGVPHHDLGGDVVALLIRHRLKRLADRLERPPRLVDPATLPQLPEVLTDRTRARAVSLIRVAGLGAKYQIVQAPRMLPRGVGNRHQRRLRLRPQWRPTIDARLLTHQFQPPRHRLQIGPPQPTQVAGNEAAVDGQ